MSLRAQPMLDGSRRSLRLSDGTKLPREGLFYAIRVPKGWALIVGRIDDADSVEHSDWFKAGVAGIVAAKWAKALNRSETDLTADIEHLYRSFPRGRVSANGDRTALTWGEKDNPQMKAAVEREFVAGGLFAWSFDPLYTPWLTEKDEMRRCLGIRDDWGAI